ncbi:archease [Candidatus Uhrbacteria bacterium]|nr:archease [Candidatus Uhrbacteria bacterium]
MPFTRNDEDKKTLFTCQGASEKDVFIDAGHALFDGLAHNNKIRGDVRQEIVIQADDLNALFVGWLKELMSRFTDMGMLYADFDVFSIQNVGAKNMVLTGAVYGEQIDTQRHTVDNAARLDEAHAACHEKAGTFSCAFSLSHSE